MKHVLIGTAVFLFTAVCSHALGSSLTSSPAYEDEGSLQQLLLYEAERQEELLAEAAMLERRLALLDEPDSTPAADSAVKRLEAAASLTEISGDGIVLTVFDPNDEGIHLPPDLLRLLLNDSFQAGAEAASVGQERITARTSIREVNGRTLVDGHSAGSLPVAISLTAPSPELAKDRINASEAAMLLKSEGFELTLELKQVDVPGFDGSYRLQMAEPAEEEDE
ncbi:DUF881 domain-containing protein [Bacillus daqingensis]|uniref:DUF881 domain-containing protein n=1 Tax=Bacillus daqingensis TaxID=872396 RepID=A0ABV9NSU3_9BACI